MPVHTHYIEGDNYQLRQVIFSNTPKAIMQCKNIAQQFKGATEMDTCRNIFNFLKNDIKYVADGAHQKVKLPSALLRERVGDCKSYSLFTAAILQNLGIPWKYVLVSYREDPTPTHIYVVTESGIIIDAVWGKFNSEKTPKHKYYHNDMKISTITGIGASKPKKQITMDSLGKKSKIEAYYGLPGEKQKYIDTLKPVKVLKSGEEGFVIESYPTNRMALVSINSEDAGIFLDGKMTKSPTGESFKLKKHTPRTIGSTGIGAPRAFIWFRDMKGRDATAGEQFEWGSKKVLYAVPRELILQVLKANGGGLSSMLYNLIFKKEPTFYTVPESDKKKLVETIENFKKSVGFKSPTSADIDRITALYNAILKGKQQGSGQKVATGGSSGSAFPGGGLPSGFALSQQQSFEIIQSMLTDSEKKSGYDRIMGIGQWDLAKRVNAYVNEQTNKLAAKYSVIPSEKARKKYGEFENKWFWLGGDPWDLNDAIQEGAKKSPRGKLFNYVIGITQTRGLNWKDTPLVVRSIVNVITGDKFSLEESGSYVMGKGVGIGMTGAEILAYAKTIMEILGVLLGLLASFGVTFGEDENENKEKNSDETSKLQWYLSNGYMVKSDAIELKAPTPYLDEATADGITVVKVDPNWFKKQFGGNELAGFGGMILPLLIGAGVLMAVNTSKKQTK